jgi:hypothetical protein
MPSAQELPKRATCRGRTAFVGSHLRGRHLALGSECLCAHPMFSDHDAGLRQAIGCFGTSPADRR